MRRLLLAVIALGVLGACGQVNGPRVQVTPRRWRSDRTPVIFVPGPSKEGPLLTSMQLS